MYIPRHGPKTLAFFPPQPLSEPLMVLCLGNGPKAPEKQQSWAKLGNAVDNIAMLCLMQLLHIILNSFR